MKKKYDVCFVGGGGHSISCADILEQNKEFNLVGFLDPSTDASLKDLGYKKLGSDEDLKKFITKFNFFFISVGQINISTKRKQLFNKVKNFNGNCITLVSKFSHVSPRAEVYEGSIIMNGATVNANATIKKNCIINSNALIEHCSVSDEHVHIAPSATILGNTFIGKESFIGAGAIIKEGITIGEKVFIKAGEVVKNDRY